MAFKAKTPVVTSAHSDKAENLRRRGNEVYKQACEGCFAPCVKRSRLERAQQLYIDALNESHTENDRASCCKNLGSLRMTYCKLELELRPTNSSSRLGDENHLFLAKFHLSKSVDFYVQALHHGIRASKPKEWQDHLHRVLVGMVEWAAEQSSNLSFPRVSLVRKLCQAFVDSLGRYPTAKCEAAVIAHKVLAESLFNEGIREFSDAEGGNDECRQYRNCLKTMHDCYEPLCIAKDLFSRLQVGMKLRQDVKDLEDQVQLYQNICESIQARIQGDKLFTMALLENEEINMELAWDAIDNYKQAALLTREQDVENEAIAMSRMGKVYSEVIKDSKKAHRYHFQATGLALCIVKVCPRIITADWYVYSSRKVEEHQNSVVFEEAKLHEQQRAAVLLRLEDKLRALADKASGSTEALLRYIYGEHRNPDRQKQLGPLDSVKSVANTLKKAILHYHPDTNKKHGEEWQVLCEEITKYLNRKYENYKLTAD